MPKSPLLLLLGLALIGSAPAATKPKPAFQYESGDIRIPIPSADEPLVAQFGARSIEAAAQYLRDGALCWVREKNCVNCHTTGPYLAEYPAIHALLRQQGIVLPQAPHPEIQDDFAQSVPAKVQPRQETEKDGHRYVSGSWSAIWRSLGLAQWDRQVSGKLSDLTRRSLDDMLACQSPHGGYVSYGEVEIPHITTDYELSVQAARALASAPDYLKSLSAPAANDAASPNPSNAQRLASLKAWLKQAKPANDYDRILALQLALDFPDCVSPQQLSQARELLLSRQHRDGGWCIRDFSSIEAWHYKVSDTVANLIRNLPDAKSPQSDPYMTGLAVSLLRQHGSPAQDPALQRAITWLKSQQRQSGRWWMHSLYRGNYHYTTYFATLQALKALALCQALEL
jgi:squalene-hopene/tetraprenyl-beta-curcumene cyclase